MSSLPSATFAYLAAELAGHRSPEPRTARVVLDVRLGTEFATAHVHGAVHIPLPELPARLSEVPDGVVWVHCASGYRATAAATLLARGGRDVIVIDDTFDAAAEVGVPVTTW